MKSVANSSRRWIFATLVPVIGCAAVLALIQAPFARRAVMELAVEYLDSSYGVRLDADSLDYNLLTLDFEFTELTLASGTDVPFLDADRVRVNLPWLAVTGSLSLTEVEVDSPTLSLIQSAEGRWNLPASDATDTGTASPFVLPAIDRLGLTNAGINVVTLEYELTATDVSLELASAAETAGTLGGSLRAVQPIQIRWGDQRTTIDSLKSEVAIDDQGLTLESFALAMPEGALVVEGRVLSPFSEPSLDLTYTADVMLDQAGHWWRSSHQLSGKVGFTGIVTGPAGSPTVTADVDALRLAWADVTELSLRGAARFGSGVVVVESAAVNYGDASLEVSGRFALGTAPEPNRLEATWRDLDSALLVRQLQLDLPYTPGGRVSGHGTDAWTEWALHSVQTATRITSHGVSDRAGVIPFEGNAQFDAIGGRWQIGVEDLAVPGLIMNGHVRGEIPGNDGPVTTGLLEGTLTARAHDLGQVAQTLSVPGFVGDNAVSGLSGTAVAQITLAGTIASPTVTGRIGDASVGFRGLSGIDLRSAFATDLRRVSLDELSARLGTNLVRGTLELDLETDSVDGLIDVELTTLSALAPARPAAIAPTGRLDGHLSVSGRMGSPHLEGEIAGDRLTLAGRAIDQLAVPGSLDEGVLEIESFEARQQGAGLLGVRGSYDLADGTHELIMTARDLSLAAIASAAPDESDLQGWIEFDVSSSGSVSNPTARGTARVDALEWAGRSLDHGEITAEIDEGALLVDASLPSLNATGHGRHSDSWTTLCSI